MTSTAPLELAPPRPAETPRPRESTESNSDFSQTLKAAKKSSPDNSDEARAADKSAKKGTPAKAAPAKGKKLEEGGDETASAGDAKRVDESAVKLSALVSDPVERGKTPKTEEKTAPDEKPAEVSPPGGVVIPQVTVKQTQQAKPNDAESVNGPTVEADEATGKTDVPGAASDGGRKLPPVSVRPVKGSSKKPSEDAKDDADSQPQAKTAAIQPVAAATAPIPTTTNATASDADDTTAVESTTRATAVPDAIIDMPKAAPPSVDKPKADFIVPTPAQFAEDNHPKIVESVHGQLLPSGGSMRISLNPPDLGALQITVHMKDGVMSAAFETSNDDATHLLSHSLGELKSALESTGVGVEKLRVEQNTKQQGESGDREGSSSTPQQQQNRRDQQRQELVKRMWRKLSGGDPLDLVA